jgi:hypothetical protein
MVFLDRRYYVAMLSAAELHGASHQAPTDNYRVRPTPDGIRQALRGAAVG